jgi:site-specific DNA recombinase
MRAGEVDVLYSVEGERLARTYLDGLQFIQASTQGGVTWHLDTDGKLDPGSPAGEETAVSIFASGRREGRVRMARQKRRYDRERANGMPIWTVRSFGYEDRIHIRESEAVHIRTAVRDYLDGNASMTAIAHRWNAMGLKTDGMQRERRGRYDDEPTPARGYWTTTTVQRLLLRPRNAGILVHKGAELPNSQIEAIITRGELEELQSRVKLGTPVGARAKSPLGGILKCECGAPMHFTQSHSQRKGGPRNVYDIYKCSQTTFDKTQRHASIRSTIAENEVALQVMGFMSIGYGIQDEAPTYSVQLRDIADKLAALDEQESRAEDALIEGLGNKARLKGKLEVIRAERAELRAERDRVEANRVGGNVFRVMSQLQDVMEGIAFGKDTPLSELESDAIERVIEAFNEVPLEDMQALIRARFVCLVKVGGRGAERVRVIPGRIVI